MRAGAVTAHIQAPRIAWIQREQRHRGHLLGTIEREPERMSIRQALAAQRHRLSETGFEGEREGYWPAVGRIGVARVACNRDGSTRTVEGIHPDRTGANGGSAEAAHARLCRAGRTARGNGAKR